MQARPALDSQQVRTREAVDLPIESGWTIDTICLNDWWINVGYLDGHTEAEHHLEDG